MSFKGVASKIAQTENIGLGAADAILASSSRNASPAAKAKNPNLKKVKGKARHKPPAGPNKAIRPTFISKGARDTSDKEGPAEDRGENRKKEGGKY